MPKEKGPHETSDPACNCGCHPESVGRVVRRSFPSRDAALPCERDEMLFWRPALGMSKRLLSQAVAADLVPDVRPAGRLLPQAGSAVVDVGALQPAGRLLPQTVPQSVPAPLPRP